MCVSSVEGRSKSVDHGSRKHDRSRQWEGDYFGAIIPKDVPQPENLPRCQTSIWYMKGNQHKADCPPV